MCRIVQLIMQKKDIIMYFLILKITLKKKKQKTFIMILQPQVFAKPAQKVHSEIIIVLLVPAYPLEQIPDFLTALFKDNSDQLFSKPFVVNTRS